MEHTRTRPPATLREASLQDLVMDAMRLGPAPTRSRELVVLLTTAVITAVAAVIIGVPIGLFVAAAAAIFMAIRWSVGVRKWGQS